MDKSVSELLKEARDAITQKDWRECKINIYKFIFLLLLL